MEEDQIEKELPRSKSISGNANQAIKGRTLTSNPFPALDFVKIEKEIIRTTEEVKKLSGASFIIKMRKKILPSDSDEKGSHLDASIIGNLVKSSSVSSIVSKIGSSPKLSLERVKLVRAVMLDDKGDSALSLYRNLMIQAALTIYLGDITPATLQITGQTYRLYLEKIISTHKKNLLVVQSKQLKNVNLDVISVNDLISKDEEEELQEHELVAIQEMKLTLKLLEYAESLDEDTRGSITMSMHLDELDALYSKKKIRGLFGGSGNADTVKNKHLLVVRKTLAAVEVMKRIPILHPIGMKIISKLQAFDNKLALPYLMEARLHMQALRFLSLRVLMDDYSARPAMTPTFNKAIVAYHKSLKRSSFTNPKRGDITVLAEFAQVSFYAYQHRKMLNLANHGVLKILEMGKKSLDALVPNNRVYLGQQKQIMKAIGSLKKFS